MNSIHWFQIIPAGQAIGLTLLHSLWQIALVGLLLRLLLLAIPSKHSNTRYFLYLGGLVAILFWSGITFSTHLEMANHPTVSRDVEEEVATFVEMPATEASAETAPAIQWQVAEEVLPHQTIADRVDAVLEQLQPWMPILAFSWYLGVLWFTFLMMRGFWELRVLHRRYTLVPDAFWTTKFEQLRAQMGIYRKVRFLLSERVKEPITFYFFRPVVLAPVQLFTGLSTEQIEVLLLHELAHIRRHDFLVNVFQGVLEVLFFYHPVVWWLSKQLRVEREHCCDDLVMSIQQQPMLYAEALTQLQFINHPSKTKLAMSATGNNNVFSTRIYRLFGKYDKRSSLAKISLISALLLLLLGSQAFMLKQNEDRLAEGITLLDANEQVLTLSPSIPAFLLPKNVTITPVTEEDATAAVAEQLAPETVSQEQVAEEEQTVEAAIAEPVSAVHHAAHSETTLVQKEQATTPVRDGNQLHLLYEAIEHDNLEVVRLLLDQGVPVNGEDEKNGKKCRCRKPLVRAVHYQRVAIAELLIERGADVNAAGSQSYTALIEAADHGLLDLVKLLISKKAAINAT
ncbi:MAG: M56 family metallopeptidase, partial [Bacteroidota bacterium]